MPTTESTSTPAICLNRKQLLAALQRVSQVVPNHSVKPILQGVRLEAADGRLRLRATDLETALVTSIAAEGSLAPCLVSGPELTRRLKAGRAGICTLQLDNKSQTLTVNGGRVEHTICTMDLAEFPPVPDRAEGQSVTVEGLAFRNALATALVGVAREASRYAINGLLLESDDDGLRLVATDGRRLVTVELEHADREFNGQVILTARQALLVSKFIDRKSHDCVRVSVKEHPEKDGERQPSEICVVGGHWLLRATELDGQFPKYGDVVPESQSQFVVGRKAFSETLCEVSLATSDDAQGVAMELKPDSVVLSARTPGAAASSGSVAATFAGGGDDHIITGFHPALLMDAVRTLPGTRIVVDVGQNLFDRVGNAVRGRPALLYSPENPHVRWLIMPINIGLEPSRETLGRNFEDDEQAESPSTEREPTADTPAEASASRPRRRRRVEHLWPAIGTRVDGQFQGETYAALVVAAPKLRSGRALQVINGPAMGRGYNSMTAAMLAATAKQRQKLGMGKGKKGLPSSGWEFWKEAEPARMSA